RDGRFLLFTTLSPKNDTDIWALPDPGRTPAEAKAFPVVATPFNEGDAVFSPDGRWIAHTSNETSPSDVYVRPFSPEKSSSVSGAKWLLSNGLSGYPRWRADGKQMLYIAAVGLNVMAVDIDTTNGFQPGAPKRLFAAPPPIT